MKEIFPEHTTMKDSCLLMHLRLFRFGLLEHCYTKFSKAHFAGLCTKISSGARQGDALCQHIFREAGRSLGELVGALLPSVSKVLSLNRSISTIDISLNVFFLNFESC